jgi:hypothetical protein
MATVRLSPRAGEADRLVDALRRMLPTLPDLPGMTGAHLLQTRAPVAGVPLTAEQRIRGGDAAADWVLLVGGYDSRALAELAASELGARALVAAGAQPGSVLSLYDLRYAMTGADF